MPTCYRRYSRAECSNLSEKLVVTSQQLKEELQETRGVDQIFIPQKNKSFAEGLAKTRKTQNHFSDKRHLICRNISKLMTISYLIWMTKEAAVLTDVLTILRSGSRTVW